MFAWIAVVLFAIAAFLDLAAINTKWLLAFVILGALSVALHLATGWMPIRRA